MCDNATGLGSEIKEELQGGFRGTESIMDKSWETEFGKGDMSLRLGRVVPDVHKGKEAVQRPNVSE